MAPRTSLVRQWSETLASSIGSSGRDDELGRNSWKKIYPPGRVVEVTMGLLMWGAVAGAVLNIVLTALLASVYARNARKVPTMFTAGLLTFAVLLLVGNAVTLWSFATMMPVYTAGLEPYVITYTWAQAAGLLALSVVTWK